MQDIGDRIGEAMYGSAERFPYDPMGWYDSLVTPEDEQDTGLDPRQARKKAAQMVSYQTMGAYGPQYE